MTVIITVRLDKQKWSAEASAVTLTCTVCQAAFSYLTAGFGAADRMAFRMLQELRHKQIVKRDRWLIALSPFWLLKNKTMQLESQTRWSWTNTAIQKTWREFRKRLGAHRPSLQPPHHLFVHSCIHHIFQLWHNKGIQTTGDHYPHNENRLGFR